MQPPKWNSQELIDRYQRDYAIDVRRFLPETEVTLRRDEASGVWMFRGGVPGDGWFYEQLHARDEYIRTAIHTLGKDQANPANSAARCTRAIPMM